MNKDESGGSTEIIGCRAGDSEKTHIRPGDFGSRTNDLSCWTVKIVEVSLFIVDLGRRAK
jgi:hypothetical protein